MLSITIGNTAKMPASTGPTLSPQRDHGADQRGHQRGAQRNVEPPPGDDGHPHMQIALRQRYAGAIGRDIEKDGPGRPTK